MFAYPLQAAGKYFNCLPLFVLLASKNSGLAFLFFKVSGVVEGVVVGPCEKATRREQNDHFFLTVIGLLYTVYNFMEPMSYV